MKVYVICSGEYSDKEIDYVTLDKDKAEELREIAEYDSWDENAWIDEFDTEDSDTAVAEGLKKAYTVWFQYGAYTIEDGEKYNDTMVTPYRDGSLEVDVWARDKDEALKIAADLRADFLAREYGIR